MKTLKRNLVKTGEWDGEPIYREKTAAEKLIALLPEFKVEIKKDGIVFEGDLNYDYKVKPAWPSTQQD